MNAPREVHLELLLGRKVRDPSGELVGRLEELVVDESSGRRFVTEFHVGKYAMLERLMGGALSRSLLRLLGGRRALVVPWDAMDLRDLRDLRLTRPASTLRELGDSARGRLAAS